MFTTYNSNNFFVKGNQLHYQSYQKKNIQFHQDIRKKQIAQKMNSIREQILASLSEDYYVLKGINLNDTLQQLSELKQQSILSDWQHADQIIKDVFIYSRSDQSDHLYYLIDDRIIAKLTTFLQISNIELFQRNPRAYIRILWTIANYTTYVSQSIEHYKEVLFSIELCKDTFFSLFLELTNLQQFYQSQKSYKIFSHVQAKQILYLILFSISNISVSTDICFSICLKANKQANFLNNLIKEFDTLSTFAKLNNIKDTLISDILGKTINILQNILKLNSESIEVMQVINEIDCQLINKLLSLLTMLFQQSKQQQIQLQITVSLRYFLDTHLYDKPQIITNNNFNILFQMFKSLSQQIMSINGNIFDYYNQLEIEGVVKESLSSLKHKSAALQKRLIQILQIFIILFRVNIPDQDSTKIYDTYIDWLQEILPIFKSFFVKKDPYSDEIRYKILTILCDACLQQDFCDIIIDQLAILSRIFYYIKSQCVQVRFKKAALNVLNSIICISLDGQSDLRIIIIQMLRNNKILEILSLYIGEFVDEDLNKNLLRSLLLYLRTQTTQDPQDHVIWAQFCQEGGDKKLLKYHSVIKNIQIQQKIEAILDEFKSF